MRRYDGQDAMATHARPGQVYIAAVCVYIYIHRPDYIVEYRRKRGTVIVGW